MYQFALIGFPIQQSLSPWIHERFLKLANLKGTYELYEIKPEQSLKSELHELKMSGIDGFNVTVPYKQAIIPYLDDLDHYAKAIKAVNTVKKKNGDWIGYNTDGIGYVRSLENSFPDLFLNKAKKILIIGAGGAARGIYYALVSEGFLHIDIANRTEDHAYSIAKLKDTSTITSILNLQQAAEKLHAYDVIIQTTSVGMYPSEEESILSTDQLKSTSIVSDIVYQPLKTRLLADAELAGASIHYGHTMLLYQAQYAFEIWTNKQVLINNMDKELENVLEGA